MARSISFSLQHIAFLVLVCAIVSWARPPSRQQAGSSSLKFVQNATNFPSEDYYDFIIVGGGTADCPLAATLSQSFKVLLLECGGAVYCKPNLMTQEGFLIILMEINTFDSLAQAFTSEDGVPNARGRVLGGSSVINTGLCSRADEDFYRMSVMNWNLKVVNETHERVEQAIVFRPELRTWQSAVREGVLEAGVYPCNGFRLEHVVGKKIGGSTFDSAGRGHTAVDLIKVAVNASVKRVLLASYSSCAGSKQAVVGIIYRDRRGGYHHAMVREKGGLILSAGSIGSPQLLLLSSIGPRPHLSSWGIPVAYHHPYVGQCMCDSPRNVISILPAIPVEHSLIQVVGITAIGAYVEAASIVIPFASPPLSVFVRTPSTPLYLTVATFLGKSVWPLSCGSLRLAAIDVRVHLFDRFYYFSDPVDVERRINCTHKVGDILRSRSMEDFGFHEWFGARNFRFVAPALPVDQADHAQMADFCCRTLSIIWHYQGGSVVVKVVHCDHLVTGIDALCVVDDQCLVYHPEPILRIDALRGVDDQGLVHHPEPILRLL